MVFMLSEVPVWHCFGGVISVPEYRYGGTKPLPICFIQISITSMVWLEEGDYARIQVLDSDICALLIPCHENIQYLNAIPVFGNFQCQLSVSFISSVRNY